MRNKQSGFTLLEMLIAIAILGIIMAMNSTLLQNMFRSTQQQGSIASSQFETALGLEIFRNDLGNAGYGLPDAFQVAITYSEPAGNPAELFNDATNPASATLNVPRAIVHSNDVSAVAAYATTGYLANSDYLVVKSPAVGMNRAAGKWTYINNDAANYIHVWGDSNLDMANGNRMIVIRARATTADMAQLVTLGTAYAATYAGSELSGGEAVVPGFRPPDPPTGDRYIVYGVDDNVALSRPFNRADYYVRRVTGTTGAGCAPRTGTLFKAVVNQGNDNFTTYPIMDCVANMQVVFRLDTDNDGVIDTTTPTLATTLTAMQIKEQVKEIQVYILAHEGTFDRGYRYGDISSTITVGPSSVVLSTLVGVNWDRYRWKTYTLFVKPRSFY
jgi:prepilin-type N-terminal cleavage/methylation domain-containing protein